MAQGRPMSRHGRYEQPFIGMPVEEADSQEFYKRADYASQGYTAASPRPKSSYRRRKSSPPSDYDQYARVPSHRGDPPARPMSRIGSDGHNQGSNPQQPLEDSDDCFCPSPPGGPLGSPSSPSHQPSRSKGYSEQPLSSRRPPSSRPQSARPKSARMQYKEQHSNEGDLTDMPAIRPPSSFTKYRLLPAIGTPTPADLDNPPPAAYLYNEPRPPSRHNPASSTPRSQHNQHPQHPPLSQRRGNNLNRHSNRISSAVSDISVISTKPTPRPAPEEEDDRVTGGIERLDLSQLERPTSSNQKKRKSSTSSPAHKPKSSSSNGKISLDQADLYDGDDDDSDSLSARQTSDSTQRSARSATMPKKPVVIPSPDNPPDKEILLAIKLPTDGSRHQRYFKVNETLQAILDFAEEVGEQDFGGYSLVSSAPKLTYSDMHVSIEDAGMEDKTVLHLEEEY